MSAPITVVIIRSLSFTGTTWFNTVLGCHPRAFAMGPADRVMDLLDEKGHWNDACVVHGPECEFWPSFKLRYQPDRNFFLQLAEAAGRDVIILNNPSAARYAHHLAHSRIEVKFIDWVRDGRAVAASYWRKWPENDFYDVVASWLAQPLRNFRFDPCDPERLGLRYEDVMADKWGSLQRAGAFIGLDYERRALRFWEHELHVTGGNQWMYQLIKLGQGLPVRHWSNWEFYERQFAAMRLDPEASFEDERWQTELGPRERFLFDVHCGEANAQLGYPRDCFTRPQLARFETELAAAEGVPEFSDDAGVPARAEAKPMTDAVPAEPSKVHSREPVAHRAANPPRLREQLRPSWMFVHGLRLTGHQSRVLVQAILLGAVAIMAAVFGLGVALA